MIDMQLIHNVVLSERRNQSGLLSGLSNPVFFIQPVEAEKKPINPTPERIGPIFQGSLSSISTTAR